MGKLNSFKKNPAGYPPPDFSILPFLVKIAKLLECSVNYFISGKYTYTIDTASQQTLDNAILEKLKERDIETKKKVPKIIDIL